MDFCFSCCLVQKLRERPYVGNVPGEAVAVYCCTVFVSVSLSMYCCLWACCVLYDIFFCVCPIDCHCVCVLTLLIWYPYKKIVCPLIFLSVIVWYKFCNVWHSGWFTCYLQEGTSVDWILLVVLWCCFRKYWFLNLSLIAGIWIDFLYPLLDVHYEFSRCGLMFLSIADSGIAKWAAAALLGLRIGLLRARGFNQIPALQVNCCEFQYYSSAASWVGYLISQSLLDCWICIDFLYPLLDDHYGLSRCGWMFLSIADSPDIAKWAAAALLGLRIGLLPARGFNPIPALQVNCCEFQ